MTHKPNKMNDQRQELFNHLSNEHDLTCLESELDLIISIVESTKYETVRSGYAKISRVTDTTPKSELIPFIMAFHKEFNGKEWTENNFWIGLSTWMEDGPSQLLKRKEQIEEVYSMDECVFEYCPNPDHCKFETKCQNPL